MKRRPGTHRPDAQLTKLVAAFVARNTTMEAARRLGISPPSVAKIAAGIGVRAGTIAIAVMRLETLDAPSGDVLDPPRAVA